MSSKVCIVTSCAIGYWNTYGRQGLVTMLQHFPEEVDIHLVSEHELPLHEIDRPAVTKREGRFQFHSLDNNHEAAVFYMRHANNKRVHGTEKHFYDFRLDAFRFSKKVFAIQLVSRMVQGRLIWLDADTVTLKPIPMDFLLRMPPEGSALAYLDRGNKYHSECGFVGYNLEHPATREFITQFAGLYATDEVFKLKEWHDSWVFDWIRNKLRVPSHKIPHTNNGHPFVCSELGHYMDHLKGARKRTGVSPEHPRFGPRRK